jgi:hypothetical protein
MGWQQQNPSPKTGGWYIPIKVDVTAQLTRLVGAVEIILSADPDIRDVVWRTP